jgi:hypothetical protein
MSMVSPSTTEMALALIGSALTLALKERRKGRRQAF